MHHCSDIYLKDWLRSLAPSLLQQQPFNQITKKGKWIISKRRLGVAILRVLRIYLQATPFFCVRFFCKNLHPNSNTNSTKKNYAISISKTCQHITENTLLLLFFVLILPPHISLFAIKKQYSTPHFSIY